MKPPLPILASLAATCLIAAAFPGSMLKKPAEWFRSAD
jgi:hypothetical protein